MSFPRRALTPFIVLFLRRYTLKRTFVHAEDQKTASGAGDLEKGSVGDAAGVEGNEAAIGAVPMTDARVKVSSKSATSSDGTKDGSTKENSC